MLTHVHVHKHTCASYMYSTCLSVSVPAVSALLRKKKILSGYLAFKDSEHGIRHGIRLMYHSVCAYHSDTPFPPIPLNSNNHMHLQYLIQKKIRQFTISIMIFNTITNTSLHGTQDKIDSSPTMLSVRLHRACPMGSNSTNMRSAMSPNKVTAVSTSKGYSISPSTRPGVSMKVIRGNFFCLEVETSVVRKSTKPLVAKDHIKL